MTKFKCMDSMRSESLLTPCHMCSVERLQSKGFVFIGDKCCLFPRGSRYGCGCHHAVNRYWGKDRLYRKKINSINIRDVMRQERACMDLNNIVL